MATLETVVEKLNTVVKTGAEKRKAVDELLDLSREVANTEHELSGLAGAKATVGNAVEKLAEAMEVAERAEHEFWGAVWRWESQAKQSQSRGRQAAVPPCLSVPTTHPPSNVEMIQGLTHPQERRSTLQASILAIQDAHVNGNDHSDYSPVVPNATSGLPTSQAYPPANFGDTPEYVTHRHRMVPPLPSAPLNAMPMSGARDVETFRVSPEIRKKSGNAPTRRVTAKSRLGDRRIGRGMVSKLPIQSERERVGTLKLWRLDGAGDILANAALAKLEATTHLMTVTEDLEEGVATLASHAEAKEKLSKTCEELAIAERRFRVLAISEDKASQVFVTWHLHRQKMGAQELSSLKWSSEEGSSQEGCSQVGSPGPRSPQKKRMRLNPDRSRSILKFYADCLRYHLDII